jgi:hypothetical protein
MNKEQIKQMLVEQRNTVLRKKNLITRESYDSLSEKLQLPHIQVITGMRRCGKSTLMKQIIQTHYPKNDFYYINFEDERLLGFKANDFTQLFEIQIELFGEHKTFFLDEVQNVENFETFVRRFADDGYKFIITGSNAKLLSSEISTKLTGRHLDTKISPFSFKEYLNFKKQPYTQNEIYQSIEKVKIKKLFAEYLIQGGMPEYVTFKDPEILMRTYEDIVLKDIVVRYGIENNLKLRELYRFMVSNSGQRFSYNSLAKASPYASPMSIIKYVEYLENTYFIKTISKFDYSIKKQQISEKKVYVIDNGFIRNISIKYSPDNGWLLENLVCMELLKKGNVFYYHHKKECDFLLEENDKLTQAIQVCWWVNEQNEQRECEGLLSAMSELSIENGFILTYDQEEEIIYKTKKIQLIPVWKWLLK